MDQSPYLAAAIRALSSPAPAAPNYGPDQATLQMMAKQIGQAAPGNGLAGGINAAFHGNIGAGARATPLPDMQQLPQAPQAITPFDLSGLTKPRLGAPG